MLACECLHGIEGGRLLGSKLELDKEVVASWLGHGKKSLV